MRHLILLTACFCLLLQALTSSADEFPYREKYPEINVIELTALKSGYDNKSFVIVDVRSKSEFDAIHIKKAMNISYANARFVDQLAEIARTYPDKKIAVYCNGIDCLKSYKAAEDAMYAMIPEVHAFDAGINKWAQAYPEATVLQGEELTNPMEQLISLEKFHQKNLDFDTFKKMSGNSNAIVIDVRDPIQRKKKVPGLEKAMQIPVDKFVHNIVAQGRMKDKQLYIFDQVGRQVNWLMYYLLDNEYTDFHFLEGGATSVLMEQDYRVAGIH